MIDINYRGRLGNNMFMYAYARLIHEKTGLMFQSKHVNTSNEPIYLHKFFKNADLCLDGLNFTNRIIVNDSNSNIENVVDFVKRNNVGILCDGFYQNSNYYEPIRNKLKTWFHIDNYLTPNKDDIVIHIRRGDYADCKYSNLHLNYYTDILDGTTFNKLYIVTTDVTDDMKIFNKYSPKFVCMDTIDDFRF